MFNEKNSDLIQAFLKGELSAEQGAKVEEKLKNDSDFKEQFLEEQLIFESIISAELFDLEKEIQSFEPKPKNRTVLKTLLFSALFAITIGGIVYIISIGSTEENQESETIPTEQTTTITDTLSNEIEHIDQNQESNILTDIHENTVVTDSIKEDTSTTPDGLQDNSPYDSDSTTNNKQTTSLGETDSLPDTTLDTSHVDDCATKHINFKFTVQATCQDQEDGSIFISNITGGAKPYQIIVEDDYNLSLLNEGSYSIHISDKDGCFSKTKDIYVPNKVCQRDQGNDHVLSIGQNGFFIIPTSGRFTVFSTNGSIVFENSFEQGDEWYGLDTYGQPLNMGDYNYLITNDNKKLSGVITILE